MRDSLKYIICITTLLLLSHSELPAQDSTLTKSRRLNLSEEHYEKGVQQFNKGVYENAISEFEKAISLNALDHLTYYFNGLSYERLNLLEKALLNYDLSLSLKPDFNEALFNRAVLNYKLEKYNSAIRDFEELLTLPSGETQAIYFRGIKYGQDDGDVGFNEIISMNKKEADIYNYLGLCYYHLQEYNKSKSCFSKAIQLNPSDDNIHVNAGLTFLAINDIDSAAFHFKESLSINPYNSVAQLNLSLCDPESAGNQINQLNELIRNNKEFPMAYAQRAYQHFLEGNYQFAILDYDSALMLDPDNLTYLLERGMLLIKIKDYEKAIIDFNAVLDYEPDNARAWFNLANAYYLKKEYSASLECYNQAIDLNPFSADLYYNRSIAYYYLKDIDNACKDMKKALTLGKTDTQEFISKYCQ